ncbi:unnamed protein product [Amoebophrya sp. A120]|nr:unnamed protein product [Amoebophrya sp. A120]|eukprot:GSA120T00009009001.1
MSDDSYIMSDDGDDSEEFEGKISEAYEKHQQEMSQRPISALSRPESHHSTRPDSSNPRGRPESHRGRPESHRGRPESHRGRPESNQLEGRIPYAAASSAVSSSSTTELRSTSNVSQALRNAADRAAGLATNRAVAGTTTTAATTPGNPGAILPNGAGGYPQQTSDLTSELSSSTNQNEANAVEMLSTVGSSQAGTTITELAGKMAHRVTAFGASGGGAPGSALSSGSSTPNTGVATGGKGQLASHQFPGGANATPSGGRSCNTLQPEQQLDEIEEEIFNPQQPLEVSNASAGEQTRRGIGRSTKEDLHVAAVTATANRSPRDPSKPVPFEPERLMRELQKGEMREENQVEQGVPAGACTSSSGANSGPNRLAEDEGKSPLLQDHETGKTAPAAATSRPPAAVDHEAEAEPEQQRPVLSQHQKEPATSDISVSTNRNNVIRDLLGATSGATSTSSSATGSRANSRKPSLTKAADFLKGDAHLLSGSSQVVDPPVTAAGSRGGAPEDVAGTAASGSGGGGGARSGLSTLIFNQELITEGKPSQPFSARSGASGTSKQQQGKNATSSARSNSRPGSRPGSGGSSRASGGRAEFLSSGVKDSTETTRTGAPVMETDAKTRTTAGEAGPTPPEYKSGTDAIRPELRALFGGGRPTSTGSRGGSASSSKPGSTTNTPRKGASGGATSVNMKGTNQKPDTSINQRLSSSSSSGSSHKTSLFFQKNSHALTFSMNNSHLPSTAAASARPRTRPPLSATFGGFGSSSAGGPGSARTSSAATGLNERDTSAEVDPTNKGPQGAAEIFPSGARNSGIKLNPAAQHQQSLVSTSSAFGRSAFSLLPENSAYDQNKYFKMGNNHFKYYTEGGNAMASSASASEDDDDYFGENAGASGSPRTRTTSSRPRGQSSSKTSSQHKNRLSMQSELGTADSRASSNAAPLLFGQLFKHSASSSGLGGGGGGAGDRSNKSLRPKTAAGHSLGETGFEEVKARAERMAEAKEAGSKRPRSAEGRPKSARQHLIEQRKTREEKEKEENKLMQLKVKELEYHILIKLSEMNQWARELKLGISYRVQFSSEQVERNRLAVYCVKLANETEMEHITLTILDKRYKALKSRYEEQRDPFAKPDPNSPAEKLKARKAKKRRFSAAPGDKPKKENPCWLPVETERARKIEIHEAYQFAKKLENKIREQLVTLAEVKQTIHPAKGGSGAGKNKGNNNLRRRASSATRAK